MPRRKTYQEFEAQAAEVHGGKYTYHQDYVNSYTKVRITCPEHGDFWQNAQSHLNGINCPKCGAQNRAKSKNHTYEIFEEKAHLEHGEKFTYHQDYVNTRTKIKITCSKHGDFYQTPNNHLRGAGCPYCANETNGKAKKKSIKAFEREATKVHKGRYAYHQDYNGADKKVKITCDEHGDFWQSATNHLQGAGCPRCKRSKGEEKIEKFLKKRGVLFWDQHRFHECKDKKPLPFDFYLPNYRICIEYQGRQHFETVNDNFFGGEEALEERQRRDQIKRDYCKKRGIILVEIPYHNELIATRILGAIAQRKREREENLIQQKLISTDWGQPFIFGEQLDLFNRPQTSP